MIKEGSETFAKSDGCPETRWMTRGRAESGVEMTNWMKERKKKEEVKKKEEDGGERRGGGKRMGEKGRRE